MLCVCTFGTAVKNMTMKIIIKPREFKCKGHWQSKMKGVVLVEKEEHIEPLWKLLCEQDDYWENYKEIIKVAPKEINGEEEISAMCQYCGKTDIYDIAEIKKKVPFILYQEYETY